MNFQHLIQNVGRSIQQNSPNILSGIAVGGVVATAYFTHKAATKAAVVKANYAYENGSEIEPKVLVDEVWRDYVVPISIAVITVTCIVGSRAIDQRRQTALISMVALGERTLSEYREKTREIVGEKKEDEIRNEIVKDRMAENPDQDVVILTGNDIRVYDVFSDRYFTSDVETLRRAQNDVNSYCYHHMYANLNMFYSAVGLQPLPLGEELGFNMDVPLDLMFRYQGDEAGKPVLALEFRRPPSQNYANLH